MLHLRFEIKVQWQTNVVTAEKFKNSELRYKVYLCVSYISYNKYWLLSTQHKWTDVVFSGRYTVNICTQFR
jgi:hypothetical protein